jgi:hypothetical protein
MEERLQIFFDERSYSNGEFMSKGTLVVSDLPKSKKITVAVQMKKSQ